MIDMKRITLFLLLMMSVMLAVAQRNVTGTVIEGDTKEPMVTWRSHANLLYANWLNYMVYQTTPYDIKTITR